MPRIFVESNWVVEVCSPAFQRSKAALALLDKAAHGEITLHLPGIALHEAQARIQDKRLPETPKKILQDFRKWSAAEGSISGAESRVVNEFLNRYSNTVESEIARLDNRIQQVADAPGVDVFALNDAMLQRALQLRREVQPKLQPFDEAILAGVLVRAAEFGDDGTKRIFCNMDRDFSPSKNKKPQRESKLITAYQAAKLEFQTHFYLPVP